MAAVRFADRLGSKSPTASSPATGGGGGSRGGPGHRRSAITFSNGHNVFGSDVAGGVPGDRENVPAAAVFATIDPATGGGLLNPNGVVSLRNDVANPALTGADPLVASAIGQLGTSPRPLPAGSLPDIGSIEINQPLSTDADPEQRRAHRQCRRQHASPHSRATTCCGGWAAPTP